MSDRIAQIADRLNRLAVPAAAARLATLGEEGSGAYNFYKVRIERGALFADYELALADALTSEGDAPPLLHEIGAGYGTFSWLMAALGCDAVCLEFDPRRREGGQALWETVRAQWPDVPGSVRYVEDRFPSAELEPSDACAVITNLVATTSDAQRAAIIAGLSRYSQAIVDVDRFLEHAQGPEQRAAVEQSFREAGLNVEPYLDLGRSAYFCRITR